MEISKGLTLHYDKNGWITETENGIGASWTMTYDKNGHMLTYGAEDSYTEGFENIYKNGRLARQIQLGGNGEKYPENPPDAYTYKYKKIMVPSSVVKRVKSQQDWLTDKGGFQKLPLAAFEPRWKPCRDDGGRWIIFGFARKKRACFLAGSFLLQYMKDCCAEVVCGVNQTFM